MLNTFHMYIDYPYVLVREVSIQVFCPLFNHIVYYFGFDLYNFFINFGY